MLLTLKDFFLQPYCAIFEQGWSTVVYIFQSGAFAALPLLALLAMIISEQ